MTIRELIAALESLPADDDTPVIVYSTDYGAEAPDPHIEEATVYHPRRVRL